ncbi:melatonin receptor type 1C-like [Dendronephthya gigantea]|uniref:melatonin receptor type 1C-like n=1 Tax=Dendronephthya gigantea TaxID=151771 RepID=UPI001069D0A3|nr:melatonin receptor type 1C-like [Dendronephthya gigantea]
MVSAWTVVEAICLVCVFIGALSGNMALFLIVAKVRTLQTKGNVFILNLAAADLMVSLVNLPITIVTVIAEDWILGNTVCLISGFITLLTFVASCMALSMISINRYHAIVHWTTYESTYTRRKCALYVFITWTITIMLSLPPFFGWASFEYDHGQSYCFAEWRVSKSYTIFMIAACLMGPLTVMSYCYIKIIRYHRESERDVIRASMTTTASTSTTFRITPDFERRPSKKRLTKTIVTLIVVFGICWSPFALIMIVQVFSSAYVPRAVDFGSLVLGYLNSFFNVIVYNVTNKKIRKEFRNLFYSVLLSKTKDSVDRSRSCSMSASTGNYI